MLKGLYNAASGFIATERSQDITANNLANVDTDGFKKDRGIKESFPEMFLHQLEAGQRPQPRGPLGTGVRLNESYTDFSSGDYRHTGNQLDLAVEGDAFFVVETPEGRRYTRSGNFTLDQEGQVVTQQGYPLQGEMGPIQTLEGSDVTVTDDGEVFIDDLNVDQLEMVEFEEPSLLEKEGENLFVAEETEEIAAEDYQIQQGYLEGSNVNVVQEMSKMIKTTRHYETHQKLVQAADETLQQTVREVGSLG